MTPKLLNNKKLHKELMKAVADVGLPTDFNLVLKTYSSSHYGKYYSKNSTIILYCFNSRGEYYSLDFLKKTVIHEAIHHYQWKHCKDFLRIKGVMHDYQFKNLERKYLNLFERGREYVHR